MPQLGCQGVPYDFFLDLLRSVADTEIRSTIKNGMCPFIFDHMSYVSRDTKGFTKQCPHPRLHSSLYDHPSLANIQLVWLFLCNSSELLRSAWQFVSSKCSHLSHSETTTIISQLIGLQKLQSWKHILQCGKYIPQQPGNMMKIALLPSPLEALEVWG